MQRPTPKKIHAEVTVAGRHLMIAEYDPALGIDGPCVVPAMGDSWRGLQELENTWAILTEIDLLAKTDLPAAIAAFHQQAD